MRPCPPFGLFDVLAHRDFARNGLVYLAYSEIRPGENWPAGQTRVIRGRLHEGALVEQRGDEINLFLPGRNYGWPVITHGMNYDGTALCESPAKEGMEQPVHYWVPSIAPCGIGFYTGNLFPRWKNHLFVTSLAAQELQRLEIEGSRVVDQEIVFKNLGRMRAVVTGPDGALYVLLPDRISRLTPAEAVVSSVAGRRRSRRGRTISGTHEPERGHLPSGRKERRRVARVGRHDGASQPWRVPSNKRRVL